MKPHHFFFTASIFALVGTVLSAMDGMGTQNTIWAFLAAWGLYFAGHFSAEASAAQEIIDLLDNSGK
jgi:hypothetical protein